MSQEPDNHELARQLAVLEERVKATSSKLEERMNTVSAKLEGEMVALKSDLKTTLEGFLKDQERHRSEMLAERISSQRWTFALVIGTAAIVVAAVAGFNLYGGGPPVP